MRRSLTILLVLLGFASLGAHAAYEREQLAIESQLQERIERILAKTLPPSSYLVTVKVEIDVRAAAASVKTKAGGRKAGNNPFLDGNRFLLPGVPQKKEFV